MEGALQNLVAALGGRDLNDSNKAYVIGDDGLGCLRDIKRWLQHHDEKHDVWDVKTILAEKNLVSTDLCPLLASWTRLETDDPMKRRISLACVEVLVPLTWPIQIGKGADRDHLEQYPNLKLAQSSYKRSILFNPEQDILSSIMRVAFPSLAVARVDRTERDKGIIRLVIYLLRNLALIDEDAHRSETILAFHKSNALDFLLVLACGSQDEFNQEDVIVLDTLYALIRGVNTETLFNLQATKPNTTGELSSLLSRESDMRRSNRSKAHTRHNRFGTMVSIITPNKQRFTVASQTAVLVSPGQSHSNFDAIDAAKKWNKTARRIASEDDVDRIVTINLEARHVLGTFVENFLQAGFNPLFTSILRALETDQGRVSSISRQQYLYCVAFFLRALQAVSEVTKKTGRKDRHLEDHAEDHCDFDQDADYKLIASVLEPRAIIMLRKMFRESLELKEYREGHAAMECFKQVLLTIQSMSLSSNSAYQEIADNMQNNIYYEESTLELVASAVRMYERQSFGYLNSVTDLACVLLRMLEKYCSTKTHMFVRARRQRQRKKKIQAKSSTTGQEPIDLQQQLEFANSDDEVAEEQARESAKDKAFEFAKFESRFMNDGCVDTFLSMLEFYRELNCEQIKRCVTFFHRVFVKGEKELLLFRIEICELFNRMINDKLGFPTSNPARVEVETFVRYYTKRLTKAIDEYPALIVELLFTKPSSDPYYLHHATDREPVAKKRPRPPAEYQTRPGLDHDQQIAVSVAVLLDENRQEYLEWLKRVLSQAVDARRAWENLHSAQVSSPGTAELVQDSSHNDILLTPDTEELSLLVFKDGKVRLLLKLLQFRRDGEREDMHAKWYIPSSTTLESLTHNLSLLHKFCFDPPTFDGQPAISFIRRENIRSIQNFTNDIETSESSDDEFYTAAPQVKVIGSTRRRKSTTGIDEEALQQRRLKKQQLEDERLAQIKSAKYVFDSDDEEGDAAFFEAEKALRRKILQRNQIGLDKKAVKPKKPRLTNRKSSITRNSTSLNDKENSPLFIQDDSDGDQSIILQAPRFSDTTSHSDLDATTVKPDQAAEAAERFLPLRVSTTKRRLIDSDDED